MDARLNANKQKIFKWMDAMILLNFRGKSLSNNVIIK